MDSYAWLVWNIQDDSIGLLPGIFLDAPMALYWASLGREAMGGVMVVDCVPWSLATEGYERLVRAALREDEIPEDELQRFEHSMYLHGGISEGGSVGNWINLDRSKLEEAGEGVVLSRGRNAA